MTPPRDANDIQQVEGDDGLRRRFDHASERHARNGRQGKDQNQGLTETTVAKIFVEQERGRRLYEHLQRTWYVYQEGIWRPDTQLLTRYAVQELCDSIGQDFQSNQRIKAVEELARAAPVLSITADEFNTEPYLLGTPMGHVDLRTGVLLPPEPGRLISLSTACAPSADQPALWLKFLNEVTGGDADLQLFLQRMAGYILTGDTREQCLFFLPGKGRNGKGVFVRALEGVLGAYAHRAPIEAFGAGPDRHPTTFAGMVGKRLVYTSETEQGKRWAEARIKDVTGGDVINARFMRRDEFEYRPAFKLLISGNHEPELQSVTDAMRDRLHIIPFDQIFVGERADRGLDKKLQDEWPAILRWAIEGCLDWQANGLVVPQRMRDAAEDYFGRQDIFTQWLNEETLQGKDLEDTPTRLYGSWSSFCKGLGENPGSIKALGTRLGQSGFKSKSTKREKKSVRIWFGLRVKQVVEPAELARYACYDTN